MNRCFLIFSYIIFLDIFNVNALPIPVPISCAVSLTNDSPISGLSFQESVSIPDIEYKRRILKVLNIDKSKINDILQIGIIRDTQKQNEMLS